MVATCVQSIYICISEVIDISPCNLESSLCFTQPGMLHYITTFKLNKQGDKIQPCHYFPNFEPVHCSISSSNCCFLTCIQVSQEAVKVVWYFHLFKNFPVCCDPHKSFSIVTEAEVDVFLEFSCFSYDPTNIGNLISGSLAFSNPACIPGSSWFTYY